MKTILILFLSLAAVFAADPAQPTVGKTPVINATNGFGGNLTVRTQLNVGYPGQAGLIQILSTNGTFTGTLSLNDQGTFVLTDDVTDGASAVGFKFATSNQLTTDGAKLMALANGATNIETVRVRTASDGYALKLSPNADASDSFIELEFDTAAQAFTLGSPDWSQTIYQYENGPNDWVQVLAFQGTPISGTRLFVLLDPHQDFGGTPFRFDTAVTISSGNLAELKNNGTDSFTVGSSGTGTFGDFSSNYYVREDIEPSVLTLLKINADTSAVLIQSNPGANTDASIQGSVAGSLKYFLEPNVDNAVSAIAYKLDTVNDLTDAGARILSVQALGVPILEVKPDGTVFVNDTTLKPVKFSTVGSLPVGSKVLYVDP